MATESGSVPKRDQPEVPIPPGWEQASVLRVYRLTPDHPEYPEEWRGDQERRAFALLEGSKRARAAAQAIVKDRTSKAGFLGELREGIGEAERRMRVDGDPSVLAKVNGTIAALDRAFAAYVPSIVQETGVAVDFVVAYLAREALPPDLALFWGTPPAPVQVLVNAGDRPVMLALHPGEYVMKGIGVGRKDIAQRVGGFITEAQRIAGKQPPRPGPEPDAAKAAAIANLKRSEPWLTARQILDRLGIHYTDSQSAQRTVRYWVRKAGELGDSTSPTAGTGDRSDGGEAIG